MFEYESLTRYPSAFRSLTGMTPDAFESLLADFASAPQRFGERCRTTRRGQPRRGAPGAGHPFAHDDRHRLLLALVWLRLYRIVVEHAIAQLNRFTVLRQVFRGQHQGHQ